jgi:hypothetical protein
MFLVQKKVLAYDCNTVIVDVGEGVQVLLELSVLALWAARGLVS